MLAVALFQTATTSTHSTICLPGIIYLAGRELPRTVAKPGTQKKKKKRTVADSLPAVYAQPLSKTPTPTVPSPLLMAPKSEQRVEGEGYPSYGTGTDGVVSWAKYQRMIAPACSGPLQSPRSSVCSYLTKSGLCPIAWIRAVTAVLHAVARKESTFTKSLTPALWWLESRLRPPPGLRRQLRTILAACWEVGSNRDIEG